APTPDSSRPPFPPPYPRSEEVDPTTSTRTPSPTRPPFPPPYPRSEEVDPTTSTRTPSPTRVKRLEGLLQQRKRRLVLSDFESEEAATTEQDIDLATLHKLASMSLGGDTTVEASYTIYKAFQDTYASSDAGHDEDEVPDNTTMPFKRTRTKRRRLRKTVTSSAFKHFQENIFAVEDTIPAGDGIPADAQTIPAGSTPIPSSGGLGEDLAKKLHAKQEAEFARQQEELVQKAQAKTVALLAEQGTELSAQRRQDLDAAQLIYTEADWLELMAKTNSALSKKLLGDDVNEENINERLGMLLMRKRRELAEQSWVKALSLAPLKHKFEYIQRTLERSNLLNFKRTTFRPTPSLEAPSAKRDRKEVPQDVHDASLQVLASVLAAPSTAAAVSVPAAPSTAAAVSVSTTLSIHADTEQIAKKRVTPIVDVADDALIKFDSASDSDDDPFPYAPFNMLSLADKAIFSGADNCPPMLEKDMYDSWRSRMGLYMFNRQHGRMILKLVEHGPLLWPTIEEDGVTRLKILKSAKAIQADCDVKATNIILQALPPEIYALVSNHKVAKDLWERIQMLMQGTWEMVPSPLGSIHAYYDMEEHTKHFTSLRELLHMMEKNDLRKLLGAVENFYQREDPDTFALILWGDLRRMLKHGLEVPKLLVGGDLTMVEQLVSFIKAALLTAQSAV
nr:hypothetical protein [Tanacetum cinerariifolium]